MGEETQNEERITELGTAKNEGGDIFCLSIIGEIEGHGVLDSTRKATKYEHLLPLLFSLEEDEATNAAELEVIADDAAETAEIKVEETAEV